MRSTRIFLLRHAETTWNVARRYQGTLDSPLSDAGRRQTLRIRDALRATPLRAVYSSPLTRALETAAAVAAPHDLPVHPHEGLSEIRVGEWEGLTVAEIEARYVEAVRRWYDTPHLTRIPGGETIEEMRSRAAAAVDEIRRRHDGETIAVVAHGGVNKTVLLTLLGAPLSSYWRIRQHNACINVLDYTGDRGVMLVMNETFHLTAHSAGERQPQRF